MAGMEDMITDFKQQIMQLRQQVLELEKDKSTLANQLEQLQNSKT